HIMFVPLIPFETVFVLDDDRGVKVPFSFKAALSGWLRGWSIMGGIGLVVGGVAAFAERLPLVGVACFVCALLSFAAFPVFGKVFPGCSEARRAELLQLIGYAPAPAHAGAPAPEAAAWTP